MTYSANRNRKILDTHDSEWEQMPVGSLRRYCHLIDCDNGTDHKPRLYIRRTDMHTFLIYCHNCGYKGFYKYNDHYTLTSIDEVTIEPDSNTYDLAAMGLLGLNSSAVHKYSIQAKTFLIAAGIITEAYEYTSPEMFHIIQQMRFDSLRNTLLLPMYNRTVLRGYQERWMEKKQFKTYIGKTKGFASDEHNTGSWLTAGMHSNDIIIVEDLPSQYRLGALGYDSLALCGTGWNAYHKSVADQYDSITLWLDKDGAGTRHALDLFRELTATKKCATIFDLEPKKCDDDKILRHLGVAF